MGETFHAQVYIAERQKNQSLGFSLANVDRLRLMLDRRKVAEDKREQLLADAIERSNRYLQEPKIFGGLPIAWVAVVPLFPWQPIVEARKCFEAHQRWAANMVFHDCQTTVQRMPNGSFSLGRASPYQGMGPCHVATTQLTTHGVVFSSAYMEGPFRAVNSESIRDALKTHLRRPFDMNQILHQVTRTLLKARELYSQSHDHIGYLKASLGFQQAWNAKLTGFGNTTDFVDSEYSHDVILDYQTFTSDPNLALRPLCEHFFFSFGMDQPTEAAQRLDLRNWQ